MPIDACDPVRSRGQGHRASRRQAPGSALALLAFLSCGSAWAGNERFRIQDGIVASLDLEATQAVVGWRFAQRPPDLVGKVEAQINGRPVGTPLGPDAFPGPGDTLLVTFLVDDGGLERTASIDAAERAIIETMKALPPFVLSRVAAYDTDFRRIAIRSAASASVDLRAAAGPRDAASDLSRALRGALETAALEPATRRAIYVYTDGSNAGTKSFDDLIALADSARVSISFVLTPSMRLADLALLERFATATGGRLLTRPNAVRDAIAMFQASGARVRFPLEGAHHFIWERATTLDVALAYGDRRLMLSSDVETPLAGASETAFFLWEREPQAVIAASLGVVALALLNVWRSARRRRKSAVAPVPERPLKS